jgi:hypothetical protein
MICPYIQQQATGDRGQVATFHLPEAIRILAFIAMFSRLVIQRIYHNKGRTAGIYTYTLRTTPAQLMEELRQKQSATFQFRILAESTKANGQQKGNGRKKQDRALPRSEGIPPFGGLFPPIATPPKDTHRSNI